MEIDKLQISITADASKAIKEYEKLGNSLAKINNALKKMQEDNSGDGFARLTQKVNEFASSVKDVTPIIKELGDSLEKIQRASSAKGMTKMVKELEKFKDVDANPGDALVDIANSDEPLSYLEQIKEMFDGISDSVKGATKAVKGFSKQIGKIVYYRVLRRTMAEISKWAKEGADNFYTFLNANQSAESKNMTRQLDRISTSLNALGNTVGVTLLTTLALLSGAIQFLSTGFIQLMNVLNATIALLKGSKTYFKANTDATKKWSQAVNNALEGFDELNVISSKTDANPMEMFTKENAAEAIDGLGVEALAVGGLALALYKLKHRTGGLTGAFKEKNETLRKQSELTEKETGKVGALNTAFSTVTDGVGAFAGALGSIGVTVAIKELFDKLKEIDNLGETAETSLGTVESAFSSKYDEILNQSKDFVNELNEILAGIGKEEAPEVPVQKPLPQKGQTSTSSEMVAFGPEATWENATFPTKKPATSTNQSASQAPSSSSTGVKYEATTLPKENLLVKLYEDTKKVGEAVAESLERVMPKLFRMALSLGVSSVVPAPGFASGGFVTSGEVFTARENGIPEMVGRIGNKTAVANNDQITEAIASAVYDAITSANMGSNVNVTLEGDAKRLFTVVQKEAKSYTRATGNYAFS